MDSYCIEELYFWKNNLDSIKVRDCFLFNKPQRFAMPALQDAVQSLPLMRIVSQALGAFRVF